MRGFSMALALCLLALAPGRAQQVPAEGEGPTQTLRERYETLLRRSTDYESGRGTPYEVVRRSGLADFERHFRDSLEVAREERDTQKALAASRLKELGNAESQLESARSDIVRLEREKGQVSWLGIPMSKVSYNLLLWGIIGILAASTALFVQRFRRSNRLTVQAKANLKDLEEEFEQHRRKALEREQKLSRELLDERNRKTEVRP